MIDPNDPRLTAYALGELDPADRAEIKSAIEASPELEKVILEIQETIGMIESTFSKEPLPNTDVDLASAVVRSASSAATEDEVGESKLEASSKQNPYEAQPRKGRFFGIVAACALLVAVGGTVLIWNLKDYSSIYRTPSVAFEAEAMNSAAEVRAKSKSAESSITVLEKSIPSSADYETAENSEVEMEASKLSEDLVAGPFGGGGFGGGGFGGGGGSRGGGGRTRSSGDSGGAEGDSLHDFSSGQQSRSFSQSGKRYKSDVQDFSNQAGGAQSEMGDQESPSRSYQKNTFGGQSGEGPASSSGRGVGNKGVAGRTQESNFDSPGRNARRGRSVAEKANSKSAPNLTPKPAPRFAPTDDIDQSVPESFEEAQKTDAASSAPKKESIELVPPPSASPARDPASPRAKAFGGEGKPADPAAVAPSQSNGKKGGADKYSYDGKAAIKQKKSSAPGGGGKSNRPSNEPVADSTQAIKGEKELSENNSRPLDLSKSIKQDELMNDEESKSKDSTPRNSVRKLDGNSEGGDADRADDKKPLELGEEDSKELALQGKGSENRKSKSVVDSKLKAKKTKNQPKPKRVTWKKAKAVPNASQLTLGKNDGLNLNGMQVNVQVDGFRARVLLDLFYYNDRAEQLEGTFKLRLPNDASLYYFAFGESSYKYQPGFKGNNLTQNEFFDDKNQFVSLRHTEIRKERVEKWDNVKEARLVQKEIANVAYTETVRKKVDPALVEWAGAGVFNARVYPLSPRKMHRIVVGYDVNLKQVGDDWTLDLGLPEDKGECHVSMSIDESMKNVLVNPIADAESMDGRTHFRWVQPGVETISLKSKSPKTTVLHSAGDTGQFFSTRFTPELPVEQASSSSNGMFLLDTSLSSDPAKFSVWLDLLQTTLTENRKEITQFNVLFFNIESHWWQEKAVENNLENVKKLMEYCNELSLHGATDLDSAFAKAAKSKEVFAGESATLFLLSDGSSTWGQDQLEQIANRINQSDLVSNLFAYQNGMSGTEVSTLRFLANQNGGAVFSVATEDEVLTAATAFRNRPWKLESIKTDGGTDVMTAGRLQWVYPGQSIVVAGRGNPTGNVLLELSSGKEKKSISVPFEQTIKSEMAERLYGQIAVGQLETMGSQLEEVAIPYARHFRVPGKNCSLLMLESEADYRRFKIVPKDDALVVKTVKADQEIRNILTQKAFTLGDPKAEMIHWLTTSESLKRIGFRQSLPLKRAIEALPKEAFEINAGQLQCVNRKKETEINANFAATILKLNGELKKARTKFSEEHPSVRSIKDRIVQITLERSKSNSSTTEFINYGRVANSYQQTSSLAKAHYMKYGVDDGLRTLSNLIERSPGDVVVARDVAYTALEWKRPTAAYFLLRRAANQNGTQGHTYTGIANCLTEMGKIDMAIVYYEIAVGANFANLRDFRKIATVEYLHLLRDIVSNKVQSNMKEFAEARMETLAKKALFDKADLVVTMMWNTNRTDVDLHVVDSRGEECSYRHPKTRMGGAITADITDGFGPEMFYVRNAKAGEFVIRAKNFASDSNRTKVASKVLLTVYENFGTENEKQTRKSITLDQVKQMVEVDKVIIKN